VDNTPEHIVNPGLEPAECKNSIRRRTTFPGPSRRPRPAPRAELLRVLMLPDFMLPDFERADRIGEFWSYPESRAFAELLIDCEQDRTLRAVLVGMLRETDRGR
jgi:hypothetical protein